MNELGVKPQVCCFLTFGNLDSTGAGPLRCFRAPFMSTNRCAPPIAQACHFQLNYLHQRQSKLGTEHAHDLPNAVASSLMLRGDASAGSCGRLLVFTRCEGLLRDQHTRQAVQLSRVSHAEALPTCQAIGSKWESSHCDLTHLGFIV